MKLSEYVKQNKTDGYTVINYMGRSDTDRVMGVYLFLEYKVPIRKIADHYQVSDSAVRYWIKQAENGHYDYIDLTDDETQILSELANDLS